VTPQVFIGPSNDGRRHGRDTYLFFSKLTNQFNGKGEKKINHLQKRKDRHVCNPTWRPTYFKGQLTQKITPKIAREIAHEIARVNGPYARTAPAGSKATSGVRDRLKQLICSKFSFFFGNRTFSLYIFYRGLFFDLPCN
jgi:hypothetical protein